MTWLIKESDWRLGVALVVCAMALLACSGIIFGWPSLLLVFAREHVYADLCAFNESTSALPMATTTSTTSTAALSTVSMSETEMNQQVKVQLCDAALLRLGLVYTLGTAGFLLTTLPFGIVLDIYGARLVALIGAAVFAIGNVFFAVHRWIDIDAAFIIGSIGIGVGGPAIYLASLTLTSLWPARPAMVIALMSCSFDAATATFLVFELINASYPNFESPWLFFSLVGLGVVVFLLGWFLWPVRAAQPPPATVTANATEAASVVESESKRHRHRRRGRKSRRRRHQQLDEEPSAAPESTSKRVSTRAMSKRTSSRRPTNQRASRRFAVVTNASMRHPLREEASKYVTENGVVVFALSRERLLVQLKSSTFWIVFTYAAVSSIFSNFYISSQELRLQQFTSDRSELVSLIRAFSFILPTSFVFVPWIGWLLDRRGLVTSLLFVQATAILRNILQMIPIAWLQIASFIVYAAWRACFFTVLIATIVRIFGNVTFGRLYGTMTFLTGIVNFVGYAMHFGAVAEDSFFAIDVVELVSSVLCLAVPLYMARASASLWLKTTDNKKSTAEKEIEKHKV
jgi:MFS family permease